MRRYLLGFLLAIGSLLLTQPELLAQKAPPLPTPKPVPLTGADSAGARAIVERYMKFIPGEWILIDSIPNYAVDELAGQLTVRRGQILAFSSNMKYRIGEIRSIRPGDTLATVSVVATGDSVPGFGPMTIDWVLFVKKVKAETWRISAIRRQVGIEDVAEKLKGLDTTRALPDALKPTIVREWSTPMLSNEQLRRNFVENRKAFGSLLHQFHRNDSLQMVGRFDRFVSQINYTVIYWDPIVTEIPKEVTDAYLATATKAEREQMQGQLKYAERMRREGLDSLKKIARKLHLDPMRLDTLGAAMKQLRLSFINSHLPWKGAVQFTVDGTFDNVGGYLYSPNDIPWVSPEEYYYLEEIGDGWWIFRST